MRRLFLACNLDKFIPSISTVFQLVMKCSSLYLIMKLHEVSFNAAGGDVTGKPG